MTAILWTILLSRLAGRFGGVWLVAALLLPWGAAADELPGTRVSILETWPPGNHVSLGSDQNFYLRLAYSTETPVRIWARPYHEGKPADAGSHPSRQYSGSGEALGWFFLVQPGTRVDEIRITAGDGRDRTTFVKAVWRGQIMAGSKPAAATPPAWVEALKAIDSAAEEQAFRERMNQPLTAWENILFGLFVPMVLLVGIIGLVWPFRALSRWRGGWRLGAMVPALLMAFIVLRLIIGVLLDPTSHNLWPFEILLAGLASGAVMVTLAVARKLLGSRRE